MKKLEFIKIKYQQYLDRKARNLAYSLGKSKKVTSLLLDYIKELYDSAKSESDFTSDNFETAYHSPISSDLEFLLARTLYHYANLKKLGWKIYLRKQVGKTAPDIRIERDNRTLAIIEIKAKAGWIQAFFSKERFDSEMKKLRAGTGKFDPRELVKKVRGQIDKYYETYNIASDQIFIFLPTLKLVHRKRYSSQMKDYDSYFQKTSGLPRKNLILLSSNFLLDLSANPSRADYKPTSRFESLISFLSKFN